MMLKRILVSQRVDVFTVYGERRDCLDQELTRFIMQTGGLPIPVPNHLSIAQELLRSLRPDGIFLSGGNSPVSCGGDAPERDETDTILLQYADKNNIPLAGICRGMQSVVLHYGGTLRACEGHVGKRHCLSGEISREVNSYHNYTVGQMPNDFVVIAEAGGDIEAIRHLRKPILTMMWHPERPSKDSGFDERDIKLVWQLWDGAAKNHMEV